MQSVRNRPKVCLSVYRLVSDSGLSTPQETTIAAEAGVQNSRLRLSAGPYFTLSDPRTKDMRSAKRVFARRQVAKRLPPPPFPCCIFQPASLTSHTPLFGAGNPAARIYSQELPLAA